MVVHVRHDATDIVLVRNGMPLFTRSVLLGVETLAEAVSRSLDIHLDESLGMLSQIPLFGMAVPEPRLGQAAQIARTVFGDITDEVGRSLEFYRSQVGDVTVSEILLCGSGCVVPQVDQFLANRLNIETVVVDPLRDVLFDSTLVRQEKRSSYTSSLGSVVEDTWLPVATVDLDLNKEGPSAAVVEGAEVHRTVPILPEAETPWFTPVLGGGIAIVVLIGLLWAYLTQFEAPRKQNELTRVETEIQNGNIQLKNLAKVREENQVLLEKKRMLDAIVHEGHPWASVLEVVRGSTPPGVQLKKVVLSGSKLTVEGLAVDFTKVSHMAINLAGSALIDDSTVNLAKRQMATDPRVVEFSIDAKIRPEGASEVVSPIASRPQVLDFYADWCGPCKQMAPIIEEAKRKYGDKVEFVTVNADDPSNRPLMDKYQVKSLPNLCFLDAKGNLVEQLIGFEGEAPILSALERVATVAQTGSTR
jgi:thiol-disulfide isomerase/thioredoxin